MSCLTGTSLLAWSGTLPNRDLSVDKFAANSIVAQKISSCEVKATRFGGPKIDPAFNFLDDQVSSTSFNEAKQVGQFSTYATTFVVRTGIPAAVGPPPFSRILLGTVDSRIIPIVQSTRVFVGTSTFYIAAFVIDMSGQVYLQDLTGQGVPAGSTISVGDTYLIAPL